MDEGKNIAWYKKQGEELEIDYCPNCDKYIFFPREICPYCLETRTEKRTSRGRGRVYTFTTVRRSALREFEDKVPYLYAIVELHEGIRMAANIVDCAPEKVRVGMPVVLAWVEEGEQKLPVFKPSASFLFPPV